MYNKIMDNTNTLFDFINISYPKFAANIKAKFLFDPELIQIPNSDYYLEVDKNLWIVYDSESDNLFSMTSDQFNEIYMAADKKAQRYVEFIFDSLSNDYPMSENPTSKLFEEIFGDLIEKPAPITKKWKLVLDLLLNKKIFISKYF